MKIIVQIEAGDFVSDDEMNPLKGELQDVAETHVGHLVDRVAVSMESVPDGV